MSKKTATPASFAQTAFQRAELEAFRRMLTVSEGTFSLSIVLCNSPALRDHLIEHVTSEMEGIQVTRIAEDTQDIFDLAQRQMPNGRPRAVFIVDMEKALAGQRSERVLQGLNVSREQWRSRHQCPVVFWIAEYVVALLSTRCRDLWSWVSHQFEFVSEQATASAGLQDSYAGNTALARNLDVHEKHFRIAELEQRIADAGDDPQGQLREHVSIWQNELACLRWSLGELDTAMALHKEQERICRQLGNLEGLSSSLGNQALILQARGDLDGAMALLKEQERICRQLGSLDGLSCTLGNQAVILKARGDLDGAMALHKEEERICRQLGTLDGLACTLGNQAVILKARGDLDGAMALLKEKERICRQLGNLAGLQTSLGNQALILKARGDLDGAMALLKEQERICRQLGNLDGLSRTLGNQALILKDRGDLDGAMALFKEVERICRQLGNVESLAIALANQAAVLAQMGRAREGLPLAEQAHQLAAQHGYAVVANQIEPVVNTMRREAQQGLAAQSDQPKPPAGPSPGANPRS
ncbi:MAG TPA: tetratricopeptide repeat protein [Phycisphaerales bacterium]|nr:tetratricopeptide repeat protein [Phycisphaerales bacterium]